ncbi:MAG: hypothetical protein FJ217_12350 [Ignavibacteria bacterium]|nr:hypothetical protein [Ignavibacteria bacterium]
MKILVMTLSFIALVWQPQDARDTNTMDLMKAYKSGKLALAFTAKDDGANLELTLKNNSKGPLVIVVPRDTLRFDLTAVRISIVNPKKKEIRLSKDGERTLTFPQTGKSRLRSGSIKTM